MKVICVSEESGIGDVKRKSNYDWSLSENRIFMCSISSYMKYGW